MSKAEKEELFLYRKIFKHLNPEKFQNSYFICGEGGAKLEEGLPEYILICPAIGLDRVYTYKKVSAI